MSVEIKSGDILCEESDSIVELFEVAGIDDEIVFPQWGSTMCIIAGTLRNAPDNGHLISSLRLPTEEELKVYEESFGV